MKKEKIIVVIPYHNSFISNDTKILSDYYEVVLNNYNWKRKELYPIYVFLQFFSLLLNIRKTSKILVQFGGYWSVIPTLLGKLFNIPVAIVLHGTDTAIIHHLNYGSMRKKLVKSVCEFSYKRAHILLPVSSSLIYTENQYISKENKQGIKYYFPDLNTQFKVIPNGLNTNFWTRLNEIKKEDNRFLAVFSESQFLIKGGDLIIQIAEKFPTYEFYIAGCDQLDSYNSPNNVHFLGRLSKNELLKEYNKAQYYFQLSIFEGFGLSLCEAMLCECIPIVSSVNILPEIIGDSGFILTRKDIVQLKNIINNTTSITDKISLGKKARERIIDNYSMQNRANLLIDTLNQL
ncbi:glycosyltransferase family 4 protein [Tenacibaculum sp. 190524A05c]|uniref:glycosyltransferase family 4 protein n=1 Tax=Tenacibaculum platacis TaxID=3137852 RepID=UPI0031FA7539